MSDSFGQLKWINWNEFLGLIIFLSLTAVYSLISSKDKIQIT